jgi:hypothetical protein
MIYKESTFSSFGAGGVPLMGVIDPSSPFDPLEKTAGIHPEVLKFKQMLEPEPNKTYVHILALGAGDFYGPNLNNDHFPWAGLSHDHTTTPHPYLHGYKTFLNAHSFAHHVNKDPAKSYGDVILSTLNNKMKRVELVVAIDHERCEKNGGKSTLQKIHDGEYPATSMGCRVPYDVCSLCGNKARFRSEYCEHMRQSPGKIMPNGEQVFVYNHFPRFFDISFVFIGADRTSFVLEKIASGSGIFVPSQYGDVEKTAASTRLSKSLRQGAGMKQKNMSMRVKRKVGRQQKLSPKLMTFGKLQKGLSQQPYAGSMLANNSMRPGSSVTLRGGGELAFNHDAQGGVDVFMNRTLTAADIEKVSSLKLAEAEKISEIFKRVNSLPMGRAVPMRVGREAMIPDDVIDQMAHRGDMPSTLGGLGAAGIMLRPREFQRMYLMSRGDHELAEDLSASGRVFAPGRPGRVGMMRVTVMGRAPSSIMQLLGPLLRERSSITPIALRRAPMMAERRFIKEGSFVDDPVLDEISAMYDSYRTELALNAEELMKTAMHTPEIMSMVRQERGGDYMSSEGVMEALSLLPVLYFVTAYNEHMCHCGMSPMEFAVQFACKNPQITKYLARLLAKC